MIFKWKFEDNTEARFHLNVGQKVYGIRKNNLRPTSVSITPLEMFKLRLYPDSYLDSILYCLDNKGTLEVCFKEVSCGASTM
jgi:hypothetical protein